MEQENIQAALDQALDPTDDRVKIGLSNMRIYPTKTQKKATYQVILDIIKLSPCYNASHITVDVLENYMQQFCVPNKKYVEPPPHDPLITFLKHLGYKVSLNLISDMYVDHMYQPWRSFATVINKCLPGKTSVRRYLEEIYVTWALFWKKRDKSTTLHKEGLKNYSQKVETASGILAKPRTIDKAGGGKLRDKNNEESWALLEDLAPYDNESWNDPSDFSKLVKAISLPQDVPSTSDRRLIKLKNQVQHLMEAHLAPNQPIQVNKITSSCEICSGPHDSQYCMENPEQAFVDYASLRTDEAGGLLEETKDVLGLADETKSYPIGIVKNVEVNVGKLKLFEDFHVVDMEREPTYPLLVGRGFLAIVNAIIYCKRESYKPRTSKDDIDAEVNPFKDILMFRKMVEFLGTIPINLKRNMWESKEVIDNKMDWDRPPKEGDIAWYIRIELIDPDGENFDRAFQSITTTRKLSPKENPSDILNLDYFHHS
ncbi:MAK10-like protein [Tanacetum coccineum]